MLGRSLRVYLYGTLPRFVLGQVLRAFLMALATLTTVFVLFLVMMEATRQGLAPQVVLKLLPFIVPGTLPFTVPVALLFAVSVVYGRLAGDNEIIAVKAAGCSVATVLAPSVVLASGLTLGLMYLSGEIIPSYNYRFKLSLFKDAEDMFFFTLKRERELNNPRWPVFIGVTDVDVEKRVLYNPTFKLRSKSDATLNSYMGTAQAKQAVIHFDMKRGVIQAELTKAIYQDAGQTVYWPYDVLEFPLPDGPNNLTVGKRAQEKTNREMSKELAEAHLKMRTERTTHAIAASLWIASGNLGRVNWQEMGETQRNAVRWARQANELETEAHTRHALAFGPICFVLLGAPVGALFARRDFLSAFMTCFIPIIALYYPLVMGGINFGKEGVFGPYCVWAGDLVLLLGASLIALPKVFKH